MRLIKLNLILCLFILGFTFSCSKNPTAGDDEPGDLVYCYGGITILSQLWREQNT